MLFIDWDNTIRLTRGDSADISLSIMNTATHEPYTIASTDQIVMSVKKSIQDTNYIFQKTTTGSGNISIIPANTQNLQFGKYFYDIQLTKSNGKVYTITGPNQFIVLAEVTT